jgi:hypothetical protein
MHLSVAAIALFAAVTADPPGKVAMDGMSSSERTRILAAIVDGGSHSCARGTRHMYVGEESNSAFYSVQCADGSDYMVEIQPDQYMSTRITPCSIMRRVGVECWRRLQD